MSAPVKKTNKIKQRTSTTTIFVKMLSTDLVPVHNDIWRKLPFSSWRDFKPCREPFLLWRQRHKGCDLNTDSEVFLYLPGALNLRCFPTHSLHFTGPNTWNSYMSLPGVLERYQSFGSMSSGATEAVSTPMHFLHNEGSNNSRVFLQLTQGF